MRIDELLGQYEEYITHEIQLAPATIASYLSDLRKYSCFTSKEVAAITADDLREYMRHMSKTGLKTATIRRKMHGFTTFWEWLKMHGHVQAVITGDLRLPRRAKTVPRWLTQEELEVFVSTPVPMVYSRWQVVRDSVAWKTLAWLGIRRGELLNLKIEDVHLDDGKVIIRDTKGKQDRVIPIPASFAKELETIINYKGRKDRIYVFGEGSKRKWSIRSFNDSFKRHLVECGLDGNGITPHSMRHTFSTHMVASTGNLAVVKELTGHKDVKSLFVYVHADPRWVKAAMDNNILNNIIDSNK